MEEVEWGGGRRGAVSLGQYEAGTMRQCQLCGFLWLERSYHNPMLRLRRGMRLSPDLNPAVLGSSFLNSSSIGLQMEDECGPGAQVSDCDV